MGKKSSTAAGLLGLKTKGRKGRKMKEGTMNGRKKSRKEGRMKKRLIMVGGMFG